jgi:hypothetical protein
VTGPPLEHVRAPEGTFLADTIGDGTKRYYVKARGRDAEGVRMLALVEGLPDPQKPDDPGKDTHDGPVVLEGSEATAWTAFNVAGFCWIDRAFKRYWEFNPDKAARIAKGEQTNRAADK